MRAGPGRTWAWIALLGALLPAPGLAFTLGGGPETGLPSEIRLEADTLHYDRQTDRMEATGHVRAVRGDTTLTVDRLLWERATGIITAEGDVTVVDGDNRLEADSILWRLNAQTGEVRNGRLMLQGRYHLEGERMERLGPDLYRVDAGLFSTCPCRKGGRRDWSVTARDIRMRVPGTLVARSVRFRILDVPVLYLPVFLFPTSPRQTGLLIPDMGWDTRDGERVELPFYWAINPSHDLTVSLDLRSRRGTGGGLWYRYMPSRASVGDVKIYGLKDRRTGRTQAEGRWHHTTRVGGGWTWHADVNAVNNRDFLRELSTATEQRTADRLESNLFAIRARRDDAVMLLARQTTSLTTSSDSTVQQLPRLRAERLLVRAGSLPVWGTAYVDGSYLYREAGARAIRVDGGPLVAARLPLWGGRLTAVPAAGARYVWYGPGADASTDRVTEAFPLSLSVAGRAVGRLFGQPHRVAPELKYRFVPVNRAQTEGFDSLETIRTEHELALGLLQALGPARWRLGASYDLEAGRTLPFRSEVDLRAGRMGSFGLDTLHAAETGHLERLIADWRIRRGWATVAAGAVFDRGTVGVGTPLDPRTLLGTPTGQNAQFNSFGVALGPWRGMSVTHRTYYDQRDGRMAEARYGLSYHGTCWTAEVVYVDLPSRNLIEFHIGPEGPPSEPEIPLEVRKPLFGAQ